MHPISIGPPENQVKTPGGVKDTAPTKQNTGPRRERRASFLKGTPVSRRRLHVYYYAGYDATPYEFSGVTPPSLLRDPLRLGSSSIAEEVGGNGHALRGRYPSRGNCLTELVFSSVEQNTLWRRDQSPQSPGPD